MMLNRKVTLTLAHLYSSLLCCLLLGAWAALEFGDEYAGRTMPLTIRVAFFIPIGALMLWAYFTRREKVPA